MIKNIKIYSEKEKRILIKTKELNEYIHNILYKPYAENLTQKDLNKVEKIILSRFDINDEEIIYNFEDLKLLSNLNSIQLDGFTIDDNIVEILNSLTNVDHLTFEHCKIESHQKILLKLEMLIIAYTQFENLEIFNEIETVDFLEIIHSENVNIKDILNFKMLESLYIEDSTIINFNQINKFKCLEELVLDASKVDDLNALEEIKNKVIFEMKEKFYLD